MAFIIQIHYRIFYLSILSFLKFWKKTLIWEITVAIKTQNFQTRLLFYIRYLREIANNYRMYILVKLQFTANLRSSGVLLMKWVK